jgi:polyisoprenoid-binding protein YceI
MSRSTLMYGIAALVLLGIGAMGGILVYNAFTAGTADPSEPITAPTLDIAAEPTISQEQAAQFATQVAELQEELAALQGQANDDANQADNADAAAPAQTLYRIVQDESEVRFNIGETLRGQRITVVGRTDQVAGDVLVSFGNPSASRVGVIRVNVRNLETPEPLRNQALRSRILQSARDEFEFAEFAPTTLEGLPEQVAIGDTIMFQIVGDLTVRGTTRTVTFDATVMVVSEERIEGLAETTVLYRDFGLSIPPNVPGVADVADEVVLEIDFVALAVEE